MPLLGSRGAASTTGFGALANLGYFLRNSLRFRSSASAFLNRTPASAGNQQKFTLSTWVKRGQLSTLQNILTLPNNSTAFRFTDANILGMYFNNGNDGYFGTTAVFRDPSAWYHIVLAIDTTQATDTNRIKLYVNGAQQTFSSVLYPSQNYNTAFNTAVLHRIGQYQSSEYFDGYMAEVNFIDGQQLTPSSFGKTDATTGQWVPKKFGGAYGTNGFYLPFTNTTSTSTLGNDFSGNSNTFTVNNISLTAGSTYDSMTDVPTLTNATTANYCVLSPLWTGSPTISNGNLQITSASSSQVAIGSLATAIGDTGKYYFEYEYTSTPSTNGGGGVWDTNSTFSAGGVPDSGTGTRYVPAGPGAGNIFKFVNGSSTLVGTYASYTTGDVIGVAFDCSAGTVSYYKNNTLQVTITDSTNFTGKAFAPYMYVYAGNVAVNFGQRPFAYTPPSGFKALNTFNLP